MQAGFPGGGSGENGRHDADAGTGDDGVDGRSGPGRGRGYPAKRRAIMDAAAQAFLREGYTRASVDAIAAAAGVSKQTVYNHFGDKERLLVAVTAAIQGEVVRQLEELLDAAFPTWSGYAIPSACAPSSRT